MGEGSDEATIEEELAELKGESEGTTDADLAELEAELDAEDGLGGTGGEDLSGVGLDSDPSEEYADLLDDQPATAAGGTADRTGDSGADDSGGILGGLFGGGGSREEAGATPEQSGSTPDRAARAADQYADLLGDSPGQAADAPADGDTETRGSLGTRLARYFSPTWFLGSAVAMLVLGGIGSTFVPLVGGPLGLAAGALVVGLVADERKYAETAVAGVVLGALASVSGAVTIAFATGAILRIAAVGAAGGLVAAVVGTYFGRDLRGALVGGSGPPADEREPPRP